MRHRDRWLALSLLVGIPGVGPALPATTTYDNQPAFFLAAGALHLEDFESAPLNGDADGGGLTRLSFDGFTVDANVPSLKIVDFEFSGNHGTTPSGERYLTADTESLMLSARLTLSFSPAIDRLGFFIVDLDSFDMGVTVNGVTYTIPDTGNNGTGFFGILSDATFTEIVLDSLGSENHYSLDDLSFPAPPAPVGGGGVPDGTLLRPGPPLQVSTEPGGDLRLTWGASCTASDTDYEVYEGVLGDFPSHVPVACSTGSARQIVIPSPPFDAYYVVVPRNATREGSYGRNSAGSERLRLSGACLLQEPPGCPP